MCFSAIVMTSKAYVTAVMNKLIYFVSHGTIRTAASEGGHFCCSFAANLLQYMWNTIWKLAPLILLPHSDAPQTCPLTWATTPFSGKHDRLVSPCLRDIGARPQRQHSFYCSGDIIICLSRPATVGHVFVSLLRMLVFCCDVFCLFVTRFTAPNLRAVFINKTQLLRNSAQVTFDTKYTRIKPPFSLALIHTSVSRAGSDHAAGKRAGGVT